MPRFPTKDSRGRKRGGSAFSRPYMLAAVTVRPVEAANVTVAPVTKPCGFGAEGNEELALADRGRRLDEGRRVVGRLSRLSDAGRHDCRRGEALPGVGT